MWETTGRHTAPCLRFRGLPPANCRHDKGNAAPSCRLFPHSEWLPPPVWAVWVSSYIFRALITVDGLQRLRKLVLVRRRRVMKRRTQYGCLNFLRASFLFKPAFPMSHSTLFDAQLKAPLRSLALTVEEAFPGEFRWRILEGHGNPPKFQSLAYSRQLFSAYDTALATGYGELQRLIGPGLQYGPRLENDIKAERFASATAATARQVLAAEGSVLRTRVVPGIEAA